MLNIKTTGSIAYLGLQAAVQMEMEALRRNQCANVPMGKYRQTLYNNPGEVKVTYKGRRFTKYEFLHQHSARTIVVQGV